MQYHDYHLKAYTVSEYGRKITLHLSYDYPNQAKRESYIEFSDVSAYHFVHTGGSIITGIEEVSVGNLLESHGHSLSGWWRLHGGYIYWNDDLMVYRSALEEKGYRGWIIDSAVGFAGFVMALNAEQKTA